MFSGNQELSKSQIRYLLQQSIKKIQPERFYVDKDEQAKNPSFIGYLSTEDSYLKPELKDGKDQFTLPVNFHIPTTKRSAQQYPDQLYHQQQLQTPNNLNNNGNNGYPQQELIQNYPNIQQLPQNAPQQNQQNFVQPTPNYVLSPQSSPQYIVQQNPQQQQLLTQQQYQNLINQNQQINQQQNQQINQPSIGVYQNQLNSVPQQGQQYSQPVDGLPIKPTTIPLAIPILQRFLERPSSLPLPEQLNIQQPQQPVPIPPQLYYVQQQQGAQPLQQGVQLLQQGVQPIQLQGIPVNGLSIAPQQIQQQQLQSQPLQGNQANGISLRADLQDNLFPQNDEQKYQQPVFSFNEPPPPAEQQIENPPQQQGNVIPPGYQNQVPVNVQNLPLVNTQPVYNGQQISQGINQGRPYYSAQTLPVQGVQNQYGPQGPLPNYQDEQQQYDRPQSEQLNQGNGGVGDPNQGQEQSTEPPIKYNINDELPPINNFQDLLAPPTPSVNQGGSYPQQNTGYRNMNPPSPDRLIYTTPDPQKFEDRVNGIRPPLREQDPLIRGDPGYKPTGQPSPVVTGLRDINIIPIDLINRNTSDKSMKLKYDLPNDLFTLPVHFATPNKTADYQRIREENRLKQNAQNIQSLYDLQKPSNPSNSQNNQNDKNINFLSNNQLLKRDHFSRIKHQSSKITPKVSESLPPKQRTKRNYYYDPPKTPFHLPGEETYSYDVPSHPFGTPMYYGNIEYRYVPLYVPKPTDFFFIIRFCPVTVQKPNNGTTNSTDTTPDVNTVAVDTATKTTTTTTTPETMTTKDMGMPPIKSTGSPSRCVWALVSCCSPGMVNQR